MPFISIFYDNFTASMPILYQKNDHSLKKQSSHAHICWKKRPFSQEHNDKIKLSWKTPAVMPIFCQKNQLCRNYTKLGAKKVNRMPFSKKKSPFSKLYYVTGRRSQNDTPISWFFMKKSLLSCTYFVKKTSIL